MITPLELRRIVRYSLSRLSAANGHHEFEELCRELARARLCDRVIPATGPVSGLGDQGRDFETYRSYVAGLRDDPTFLGLGPDAVIVFACTLQAARVAEKVWADVESIMSHQRLPTSAIVAMTETDMPIGKRNNLRARAHEVYDVDLQILDGTAIADLIARADTAWIATRFLDLPETYIPQPRPDPDDSRYLDERAKWAARESAQMTWGDFDDLRASLRYVYLESRFEEDLDWWLALMEPMARQNEDTRLRRAAIYERSVALIRAVGDARPVLDDLEWYFGTIADVLPSEELEDAQALLSFCFGGSAMLDAGLTQDAVLRWHKNLRDHLDAEIAAADNPARTFGLELSRGAIEIFTMSSTSSFEPIEKHWRVALGLAGATSLRSIDTLADRITPLAPAFEADPRLHIFIRDVEVVLADQEGAAAVAQRAHDRGLACAQADKPLAALRELHAARDGWVEAHATAELLSTLGQIAVCYRHLQLLWASKYYFLVSATLAANAGHEHSWYLSKGLLEAAICDYRLGDWSGFLQLAQMGLRAHTIFDPDAGDFDRYEVVSQVMHAAGLVYSVSAHHVPELADPAKNVASHLMPEDLLDELRERPPSWLTDPGEAARTFADQESIRPFHDQSDPASCNWQALGVTWHLESSRAHRHEAQRLAVMMQVLQADLGDEDLCPLPMVARVRVRTNSTPETVESSDPAYTFDVRVRSIADEAEHDVLQEVGAQTLASAVTLIGMTCVLPMDDVMQRIHARFERGLTSKLTTYRLYDQLARQWLTDVDLPTGRPLGVPTWPAEHAELAWPSGLGPHYSAERAQASLENRYKTFADATRYTRVRLAGSDTFRQLVERLRERGWLDWHVMGAIHGVALSYRAHLLGPVRDAEEFRARIGDPFAAESADAPPVPAATFTEDAVVTTHMTGTAAALGTAWDHTLHLRRPPVDAVTEFLRVRYRHYDDDVPHDPLF